MANLKLTSLLLRLQRPVLDTASYGSGKKSANLLAGNSKKVVGGVGNIGTDQKGQLWNPSRRFVQKKFNMYNLTTVTTITCVIKSYWKLKDLAPSNPTAENSGPIVFSCLKDMVVASAPRSEPKKNDFRDRELKLFFVTHGRAD